MSKVKLFDPSATSAEKEYKAEDLLFSDIEGKVVGFIDNAKPNFDVLAERMATILKEQFGAADVIVRQKRAATEPAPEEMYDELAEQCDLVITGSGD